MYASSVDLLIEIITHMAENSQQAMSIVKEINAVSEEEWHAWFVAKNAKEKWKCQNCSSPDQAYFEHFCVQCYTQERREQFLKVQQHLARARNAKLPATLTYREWMQSRAYFEDCCAYCGTKLTEKTIILEHYTPIEHKGGTSVDNILPACDRCNGRKGHKLPDEFSGLFPVTMMDRISAYFAFVERKSHA